MASPRPFLSNGSACHPAGRVIGIAGPHAPGGPGAHRARVGLTLPDTHASGDVYEIEPVQERHLTWVTLA